ncbi:magnesium transporter [Leucobacter luti]|uniref:Magnesium transporter MgtE n=1 Tax=Leucobacter luti TaxID=340320 RepID=A0A4R6RU69_9MICO|nr:magnesium transporter [Leucobacter luti]MCW2288054.1 magnesium transporter [Leucobacter luti]QYM75956.1 magnesium transporter [Leucobacter luti]TCK45784.1 magnesium transporter [Leucobacter luti]TDP90324.1 magnesium transporter [Leucobacter luti]
MTISDIQSTDDLVATIAQLFAARDLTALTNALTPVSPDDLVPVFERLSRKQRAVIYRLLAKDRAAELFELLDPPLQSDLLHGLQDAEVSQLFADLDHDDRLWLLDEVPAALATRLLRGLPEHERVLTSALLGYPQGSIGRRMSLEYVSTRESFTVAETMERVRARLADAETVYTIPVLDDSRHVVGIVSLRELLSAADDTPISQLMSAARMASAQDDAEFAARRCADLALLAMPIVDREHRLVGMLTIDDAIRILEHEESEDAARQGGTEPLRRPYLSTPVGALVRSRVIWLLVLAVGATLTVQVLSVFETTIAEVTVLALFVPLLIGTGGNTGNQAATTVTRALALGDVKSRDFARVLTRELRTGGMLGLLLGTLGFTIAAIAYSPQIGLVIGLTLLCVCTLAAAVGGCMPLIARAVKVDPAVFSNPFISTFVDASGLIIYFLIARAILGL